MNHYPSQQPLYISFRLGNIASIVYLIIEIIVMLWLKMSRLWQSRKPVRSLCHDKVCNCSFTTPDQCRRLSTGIMPGALFGVDAARLGLREPALALGPAHSSLLC
jgi:hypothetical protein